MSDPVEHLLARFQMAGTRSLPALLNAELEIQQRFLAGREEFPLRALAELIELDPFCHARVLDRGTSAGHAVAADELIETHGASTVLGEVSQLALRTALQPPDAGDADFLRHYWGLSRRTLLAARQLAKRCPVGDVRMLDLCARFINLGELVLENVHGRAYREFHKQDCHGHSRTALLAEEARRFGCNQAQAGTALLGRWGIGEFDSAGVRYQGEALEDIRDAGGTVAACWLAVRLAASDHPDPETVAAARALFGFEAGEITEIHQAMLHEFSDTAARLGMHRHAGGQDLSGSAGASADNAPAARAEDDPAVRELHERVRELATFNTACSFFVRDAGNAAARDRESVFRRILREFFGNRPGIVFAATEDGGWLAPWISSLEALPEEEIRIECSPGRGMIADCLRTGEETFSARRQHGLSVADRRVIALLGGDSLFCFPVRAGGSGVAVVAIGLAGTELPPWHGRAAVREMLEFTLAANLVDRSAEKQQSGDVLWREKIREAVHETGNPLSIIKNYLQLLKRKQHDDADTREQIGIIEGEIDRVGDIIGRLRDDGNSGLAPRQDDVDVNALIGELNKIFASSLFVQKSISVQLDLDPGLEMIRSRQNTLKQILTNLIKNATEALPPGGDGEIVLETRNNVRVGNMEYIQIRICDNGPGIPESVMEKLYRPHNSSKGSEHRGSGLAIVKGLMEDLGGQVLCQSSGSGTCFTLLLPKVRRRAPASGNRDD